LIYKKITALKSEPFALFCDYWQLQLSQHSNVSHFVSDVDVALLQPT